jgi:uncharacterized surface protein with fasciclin (FAS1) repeats
MSNITQVVNVDKTLTTLKKGVIASGLNKILSGTGPFTVFAPSDLAFGKLDNGVVEDLLKAENKAKLIEVLNDHVVSGKYNTKDLKDGEKLKTVSGKELLVRISDGELTVDGVKIQNPDLQTSNGVIHSLDTVMMKN